MQQIRSSVFETNSSSSHSLVVCSDGNLTLAPFSKYEIERGFVGVISGEYGWDIETFHDVYDKLSYIYTDACRSLEKTDDPNTVQNKKLNLIRKAIKLHTGLECVFLKEDDEWYPFGYIDHQSVGETYEVWDRGVDSVIDFLFNKKSYFETDNDNH